MSGWQVTPAEAREIQLRLAGQVSRTGKIDSPRFIAGIDLSPPDSDGIATGAAVVLSYPELEVVEVQVSNGRLTFPYVPGLLSFREAPLLLETIRKLSIMPDLILVDGQGVAHPRRFGIASHIGVLLDIPTIGCAKSRLCGGHETPGNERGSHAELIDKDEVIGVALRTKQGTRPVYVSIGHRVDLETAVFWALECCRGYRLPEPTRLAHMAAAGNLKMKKEVVRAHAGKQI